jgi:nitrogen regulatory protein P-II 1
MRLDQAGPDLRAGCRTVPHRGAPLNGGSMFLTKEAAMKLIKAIVRPNKVDDVRGALEAAGIPGMTVTEVRGHGRQKGHTAIYRGKEYNVTLLPKVEIEVVVPDEVADDVIAAVIKAARTGEIGDGRVFVQTVEQSYNIRTGAREL